jgi:hypothetical protein
MGEQYTTPTRMALFVTITASLAGLFVSVSRAADDCLAKPNAAAPPGSHWYYRVDRPTHRQCWYLGPEGREVRTRGREDGSPARSRPSNTIAQTAAQTPTPVETAEAQGAGPSVPEPVLVEIASSEAKAAEATGTGPLAAEPVPIEIAPGQAKTAEINSTASAARYSAIPTSSLSIDTTLLSMRDGYAGEKSITDSEDEIKPAELSAAQRPSEFPISLTQLSAIVAIWLGLVALIAPILFRLSALRKRARLKARQGDTSTRRGIRRKALKATPTPRDAGLDFESNVRQLLQEFQWRQRCGISNAINPYPLV